MPQSLAKLNVHIVFSTKHRHPFFTDLSLRNHVHAYLSGICRNMSCCPTEINGMNDHVHILCNLGRQVCIADLIRNLKSNSSKWIHGEYDSLHDFKWQKGYGAFAVSESIIPRVRIYIQNQEIHHQNQSFQEEFRKLCKAYNLVIDDRYVWE